MKYTYRIIQDDDPINPREHYDNFGTMICWHNRSNLGDEQWRYGSQYFGCFLSGLLDDFGIWRDTDQFDDFIYDLENDDQESINKALEMLDNHLFLLPLFLYEHGGMTMNTRGFYDPWDSGRVGFIYVTRDEILENWNRERLSKKLIDQAYDLLRAEVKDYDQYLTGDIYFYVIENEDGEELELAGNWGYSECINEAEEAIKHFERG